MGTLREIAHKATSNKAKLLSGLIDHDSPPVEDRGSCMLLTSNCHHQRPRRHIVGAPLRLPPLPPPSSPELRIHPFTLGTKTAAPNCLAANFHTQISRQFGPLYRAVSP
uniref:HDC02826 n=1 Tax=Drosophila melanogaster TaxID=7227 RepID=Q6IHB4_DROME|nr:TPA_inf: HDC02826 [Drosophila melanogaster]